MLPDADDPGIVSQRSASSEMRRSDPTVTEPCSSPSGEESVLLFGAADAAGAHARPSRRSSGLKVIGVRVD